MPVQKQNWADWEAPHSALQSRWKVWFCFGEARACSKRSGIVVVHVLKKVLQCAGIKDVFTSSCGSTKTLGNFVKATFDC
ncbi:hypothetical protein L7F22_029528 [Adiantum nelumboides]|nr:hypothetical protein [Adiantum nelumboides]